MKKLLVALLALVLFSCENKEYKPSNSVELNKLKSGQNYPYKKLKQFDEWR